MDANRHRQCANLFERHKKFSTLTNCENLMTDKEQFQKSNTGASEITVKIKLNLN